MVEQQVAHELRVDTGPELAAHAGGRSRFVQSAPAGPHAGTHVAGSADFRSYAPGVLTAPTVVAPFGLWAVRGPDRAVIRLKPSSRGLLRFPMIIGTARGIVRLATRVRENTAGMTNSGP